MGHHAPDGATKWRVVWQDSVGSTMEWARQQARAGAADRSVFAAREQAAGRGRTGRTWTSPRGGLYASLLLRGPSRQWGGFLPLVGALAVQEALSRLAPACRFGVKWPNDVLAGRAGQDDWQGKVAGVLTEATATADRLDWVIVGLGVNLGVQEEDLPVDVDPPAVSLVSLGKGAPSLEKTLGDLLEAFDAILGRHNTKPLGVLRDVEKVLAFRGREVQVGLRGGADREVMGTLVGLDDEARVVLATGDGVVHLEAWDVERLRPR